jgi:hypothetical protein
VTIGADEVDAVSPAERIAGLAIVRLLRVAAEVHAARNKALDHSPEFRLRDAKGQVVTGSRLRLNEEHAATTECNVEHVVVGSVRYGILDTEDVCQVSR